METYRWEEAAQKWLDERSEKADIRGDRAKLDWLGPHLEGRRLRDITRDMVRKVVEQKNTPATRNRYVALIRAIMRAAQREWGWLDAMPALKTYPEPKRRIRSLTKEQVQRLIQELQPHAADMFLFALATGLRQGNVKHMQWDWVDMDARALYVPDTKNGEPLGVPLNDVAMSVLTKQIGKHHRWVFTYCGKPVRNVNTRAWQDALKRAGIVGFRWHDATRHTWASWLAQAGVQMYALQEMGGWKSVQMVRRYAHLKVGHLMESSRTIDNVLRGTD